MGPDWLAKWFRGAGEGDPSPSAWHEKREHPRLDADIDDALRVVIEPGEDGMVLSARLKNVSIAGCKLLVNPDQGTRIAAGARLQIRLESDAFSLPLAVEVLRCSREGEMAVRFLPPYPKGFAQLDRFLAPRCLGLSLREIRQDALQDPGVGHFRWFQGANDTNLFSWHHAASQATLQQQLIFLERVLEWRDGQGVRTGRIDAERAAGFSGYRYAQSDLLIFDDTLDTAVVRDGRALITASGIDTAVKDAFLRGVPDGGG